MTLGGNPRVVQVFKRGLGRLASGGGGPARGGVFARGGAAKVGVGVAAAGSGAGVGSGGLADGLESKDLVRSESLIEGLGDVMCSPSQSTAATTPPKPCSSGHPTYPTPKHSNQLSILRLSSNIVHGVKGELTL